MYQRLPTSSKTPEKVGFFDKITFSRARDFLWTGSQRELSESDLIPLQKDDFSECITDRLSHFWDEEREKSRPKFWKAAVKCLKVEIIQEVLLGVPMPLSRFFLCVLLGLLLDEITRTDTRLLWCGIYVLGISLSSLVQAFFNQNFFYYTNTSGLRLKIGCIGMIYRKILRLSHTALSKINTGYVITLASADLAFFHNSTLSVHNILQGPVELVFGLVVMWYYIGIFSLIGVGIVLLLIPFQIFTGQYSGYHLRNKIARETQKRVNLIGEMLSGIRVIKMNTWEWSIKKLVHQIRAREMALIFKRRMVVVLQAIISDSFGAVTAFVTLLTFVYSGHTLTPSNVFVTLSVLTGLRLKMGYQFHLGLFYSLECLSSLERIQNFLEAEERDESPLQPSKSIWKSLGESNNNPKEGSGRSVPQDLTLSEVCASWDRSEGVSALSDISVAFPAGKLSLVIGSVGSGKSALLLSLLGEMYITSGTITKHGKTISYMSQSAWLLSGTIRENILFNRAYDEQRFCKVLEVCDLNKDLELLPSGDLTLIGEKGITLSGGQRLRVTLARAVYADADVYLLDDPLSAVDKQVAETIFQKCILEFLGGKTRIMVTHSIETLPQADHVIVMDKGAVSCQGGYDFVNENIGLSHVISRHEDNSPTDDKASLRGESVGIVEEDRQEGNVTLKTHLDYLNAGAPYAVIVLLFLVFVISQVGVVMTDWWLSEWTKLPFHNQQEVINIYIYSGLVCGSFLLISIKCFSFYLITYGSSLNHHDKMVSAILKAPVLFFDTNPKGRILNRFSGDTNVMDIVLPMYYHESISKILSHLAAVVFASVVSAWVCIASLPLLGVVVWLRWYFIKASSQVERIKCITSSPVFAKISTTINGLVDIRAFGMEQNFIQEFDKSQDSHSRAFQSNLVAGRWLSLRVELVCWLFVTAVAVAVTFSNTEPGLAGVALTYAIHLMMETQWTVKRSTEAETLMTSVERVQKYVQLQPEPGYKLQKFAPDSWPQFGRIACREVSLSYTKDGPRTIDDISFEIKAGEKVGIIGRTGAGKSSLLAALFRMPEFTGDVIVDGVSGSDLNLQSYRRAFASIPQTPCLFSKTLRENLDPEHGLDDADLWRALEDVQMKDVVNSLQDKLDHKLSEGGSNFSAGEQQLLCLARAILLDRKIVLIDEATANVDSATDRAVQKIIRDRFSHCTVLCIAHRLDTVKDYDRLLVFKDGKVVDFDTPDVILTRHQPDHISSL